MMADEKIGFLTTLVPRAPDWSINWDVIKNTALAPYLSKMSETPQNPVWHGEGDVLTHTKMVCGELVRSEEFRGETEKNRLILFIAALLHDVGKNVCTVIEDDLPVSPYHAVTGSIIARELLWREFGLCGTDERRDIRECVCGLIRYHSAPLHTAEQDDSEYRLIRIASQGELVPSFSLRLLRILVTADIRGRICGGLESSLEAAEFCFMLAEEAGVLYSPKKFSSSYAERAYFSGMRIMPEQELYDASWGEVTMLSGLPGTGKDTYIRKNFPDIPMISLDEIRRAKNIPPDKPQGEVVAAAREKAAELLRSKQPFVWNATNISSAVRGKQVRLFENYGASVNIIFLETDWEKQLARNSSRENEVPFPAIIRMFRQLEPPARCEAAKVGYICI